MNHPPASIEAEGKWAGGGVLRIGSASQPLVVTAECDFFPNIPGYDIVCTYTATNTVNMSTDGSSPMRISGAPVTASGGSGLCGSGGPLTLSVEDNVSDVGGGYPYISRSS